MRTMKSAHKTSETDSYKLIDAYSVHGRGVLQLELEKALLSSEFMNKMKSIADEIISAGSDVYEPEEKSKYLSKCADIVRKHISFEELNLNGD